MLLRSLILYPRIIMRKRRISFASLVNSCRSLRRCAHVLRAQGSAHGCAADMMTNHDTSPAAILSNPLGVARSLNWSLSKEGEGKRGASVLLSGEEMSAGRAIAMIWAAVPRELGCEAVSDGPFEISATVPAGTAIFGPGHPRP